MERKVANVANAALIALTSPLLLGQAPDVALQGETPVVVTEEARAHFEPPRGAVGGPAGLLNLSWSLTAAQAVPDAPPEEEEEERDQNDEAQSQDENVIVVEGSYGPPENDPIERINEESYRITQNLDDAIVEPVAYAYRDGLPGPLRQGLGNVVNNLREPNNALNFLLQGKIGKTFETLGRLMINSTLGLGGLIDIAEKPGINLPRRRNGFANTMGFYGIGSGPYLYLPVTGATTARDVTGSFLDQLLLPVAVGEPFNRLEFSVPFYLVSNLEDRLEFDAELARIDDTLNPYAARRDSYLYRREAEIAALKGEEPPEAPAIMEEVEGTGDFADLPEEVEEPTVEGEETPEPLAAVVITRPR
ncbi:MAG: VacJ family lipoprotein [Erythrobacter sp.]|uniref:MlaA family lipoprotein n=1 Tax=Erythrobacter sp. TaxID=1042 RepID=UPI00262481A9|nr:VacJ family lipoprotein [Erythrobacter sp.]MDJ0979586.1 VacJ family lipoprotein [Erythrobacter sp.]